MTTILICDDDREIVEAIAIYLRAEGYAVVKAYTGKEAAGLMMDTSIQLIIMDIMMPEMDGLTAMLKIRAFQNIPIILLSAKSEDADKILGLQMGADDYMTKPFNPLELIARVKSQLRRYTQLGGTVQQTGVFQTGGLVVDDMSKTVSVDGVAVKFTPVQYKILLLLIQNQGRVFTIDEIYERVWNEMAHQVENTVAVHIRNIREKIEINPKEPNYLKVVWGIGYKVEKIQ